MTAQPLDIDAVARYLRDFAEKRDWVQYHTPKNLVMALSVEVAELLELFQWTTPEQSMEIMEGPSAEQVRDEMADILQYLVRLADILEVDLEETVWRKLRENKSRFPND